MMNYLHHLRFYTGRLSVKGYVLVQIVPTIQIMVPGPYRSCIVIATGCYLTICLRIVCMVYLRVTLIAVFTGIVQNVHIMICSLEMQLHKSCMVEIIHNYIKYFEADA